MQVISDNVNPLFSSLNHIGWNDHWEALFSQYSDPYIPGRVCTVHKNRYDVFIPGKLISVPISGAMKAKKLYPVVGDFVVIRNQPESASIMIVSILPRNNYLSRGGAGESAIEQLLVANIDTAFIVTEPGSDFNIPRIERYLLIVRTSGANPVIILNKSDTCTDTTSYFHAIQSDIGDIPVISVSALQNDELEQIQPYLVPGETVVFLGSSGVGKSTLINALIGAPFQKTGNIRENDGKGRHTTTVRNLITLPNGCSLIDTPGLREIRVWTTGEHLSEAYEDIQYYASHCKFADCTHQSEPGCAVNQAVQEGQISQGRLDRYHKIQKEIAFERDKAEIGLKRIEKKRFKSISKLIKDYCETPKYKKNN